MDGENRDGEKFPLLRRPSRPRASDYHAAMRPPSLIEQPEKYCAKTFEAVEAALQVRPHWRDLFLEQARQAEPLGPAAVDGAVARWYIPAVMCSVPGHMTALDAWVETVRELIAERGEG